MKLYASAFGGGSLSDGMAQQSLMITFDTKVVSDFTFSSNGDVSLTTSK